jgi:hypothetical protein
MPNRVRVQQRLERPQPFALSRDGVLERVCLLVRRHATVSRRRSSAARSPSLPDSSIARLIATTGDAWNRASSAYGAAIYQVEAS